MTTRADSPCQPGVFPAEDFQTLSEALAWVYNLQKFGIKFGLSSTARLAASLGQPQSHGKFVHIAGTNGKGSVAAMLSAILTQAGYRVGLYSSPHLVRFNERFRFQEQDISDAEVLALINKVKRVVNPRELPTFFEFVTAMAFLYYRQQQADLVILETGMGGRLDATNIVQPLLTIITNIAMDHREFLGHNLEMIAAEKAGIIKPGVPLITYVQQERALTPILAAVSALKAPLYRGGRDFRAIRNGVDAFIYQGLRETLKDLRTNLLGRHQYRNAALALAAVELLRERGYAISEEAVRQGLTRVRWPGRLEQVLDRPRCLLDGAHNPAAATALAQVLRHELTYRRLILVLGVMADKDIAGILKRLVPLAQVVIFSRPSYERAAPPEQLAAAAGSLPPEHYVIPDLGAALELAQRLAGPDDLIVVTGSLFTVGEARALLLPAPETGRATFQPVRG